MGRCCCCFSFSYNFTSQFVLRLEISDEILLRAVTDAVERQLSRVNDLTGYVDMKGTF